MITIFIISKNEDLILKIYKILTRTNVYNKIVLGDVYGKDNYAH